jgi:hypothetical protein
MTAVGCRSYGDATRKYICIANVCYREIYLQFQEVNCYGHEHVKISNKFAVLENLADISKSWESIRENIKTSALGSLGNYSKTSLIWTNWEQTLVQISESLNYRSATENMFREFIKWTSHVLLSNITVLFSLCNFFFSEILVSEASSLRICSLASDFLGLECFDFK